MKVFLRPWSVSALADLLVAAVDDLAVAALGLAADSSASGRCEVLFATVPDLLFRIEATSLSPVLSLLVIDSYHLFNQLFNICSCVTGRCTRIKNTAALQHGITIRHTPRN